MGKGGRVLHLTRRGRIVVGITAAGLVSAVVLPLTLGGGSTPTAAVVAPSPAAATTAPPPTSPAPGTGTSPTQRPAPTPSPTAPQHSLTDPTSIWVVVNKARPLDPRTYVPPDLTSVGDGQYLRAPAAAALLSLFASAAADGLSIHADSGYRSYTYQVSVHDNVVASLGQSEADIGSARPGYSEHQTGWAVDVGGDGCEIATCFGTTPDGRWVAANAYRYGFIVRYPQGLQGITGYEYEPWHIRYVGVQLATAMHATGVQTLEQWFHLPAAPAYLRSS